MAVWQAEREGLTNFSMLVSHVLVPPAIRLLLGFPDNRVQGFIAPGHVCTVMGYSEYEELAARIPRARSWSADSSRSTCWRPSSCWCAQLEEGRAEVENQYVRAVTREGNAPRADRMDRGLRSRRPQMARHRRDPRVRATACARSSPPSMPSASSACRPPRVEEPAECITALVLQGLAKPVDCPAFGTRCTPETPLGAPMVSSEGACAAYYQFRRHRMITCPTAHSPPRTASCSATAPAASSARSCCAMSSCPSSAVPCSAAWTTRRCSQIGGERLAFTTDSFVVKPLFFRGGDIGSLAVHGTVNDLAMGGAEPLYLSAAFILEEGLAIDDAARIADSMARAAEAAGVEIVTGDTKVVEKGKGDGVFINTTGIGRVPRRRATSPPPTSAPAIASCSRGSIGDHGIAILSEREELGFDAPVDSDSAALHTLVRDMLDAVARHPLHARPDARRREQHAQRDRGAIAGVGIELERTAIPVREEVRGACELLGLDPLYVANEGKLVAIVAAGGLRMPCWPPCARIRWAATPRSSAPSPTSTRAWSRRRRLRHHPDRRHAGRRPIAAHLLTVPAPHRFSSKHRMWQEGSHEGTPSGIAGIAVSPGFRSERSDWAKQLLGWHYTFCPDFQHKQHRWNRRRLHPVLHQQFFFRFYASPEFQLLSQRVRAYSRRLDANRRLGKYLQRRARRLKPRPIHQRLLRRDSAHAQL